MEQWSRGDLRNMAVASDTSPVVKEKSEVSELVAAGHLTTTRGNTVLIVLRKSVRCREHEHDWRQF